MDAVYASWARGSALPDDLEEEAVRWAWLQLTDSYTFPTGVGDVPAASLLHEVGFHWYHYSDNSSNDSGFGLIGEDCLCSAIGAFRRVAVTGISRALGTTIGWSSCEFGFPARAPGPKADIDADAPFYADATELFQAGKLVRMATTLYAEGAAWLMWHTHLSSPVSADGTHKGIKPWRTFSVMGLRNDYFEAPSIARWEALRDAIARPAWHALHRLSVLLAKTDSAAVETPTGDGAMIISLHFARPFGSSRFRRAWLVWLDDAPNASSTFTLRLTRRTSDAIPFTVYPLVPTVTPVSGGAAQNPGYPPDGDVDWTATPPTTTVTQTVSARTGWAELEIRVMPAHPVDNPAPFCIFTDAVRVSS